MNGVPLWSSPKNLTSIFAGGMLKLWQPLYEYTAPGAKTGY